MLLERAIAQRVPKRFSPVFKQVTEGLRIHLLT